LGGSIYGKGKRTFRLEFSHNGSPYGYMLFISQAETEAVLRTGWEKQMSPSTRGRIRGVVTIHRGESVRAILKHREVSLEEVNPDYLFGSDGAHDISRTTRQAVQCSL